MAHERPTAARRPERVTEADGSVLDVFALPTDPASLEELLRDLFENHWQEITFGPIIQGAAWEMQAASAPTHIGVLDGYITIAFGAPHFHLCIGEYKGMGGRPASAELARHRRTARAELYRLLDGDGNPVSWGVRLFNGKDEQQITVLLPNPFLSPHNEKILESPDWSRLALWDRLRARWLGQTEPDPLDRSARRFRHG
ncbi:MAG TPA: hypothetical protein VJ739_06370 [Gemmataceae bacterium]|nr:hypothetical protein [Gemmataceae bacterium]